MKDPGRCFPWLVSVCILAALFFCSTQAQATFSRQPSPPPNNRTHLQQQEEKSHSLHSTSPQIDLFLVPGSLGLSKHTVDPDQKVRITALAFNHSDTRLNRIRVRFSCSRKHEDVFINLDPNKPKAVHAELAIAGPPGDKTIQVEVNPTHREPKESNYRNNRESVKIKVVRPGKADNRRGAASRLQPAHTAPSRLQPTHTHTPSISPTRKADVAIVRQSVKAGKATIAAGQSAAITAFVRNNGKQSLKRVRVRFSCGAGKKDTFVDLPANERRRIKTTLSIPGPAGKKTIRVEVNPLHRELAETSYRNNTSTTRITVIDRDSRERPGISGFTPQEQGQPSTGDNKPGNMQRPVLISRMYPNRLIIGKEYLVKLSGSNLTTGLNPDFGPGIKQTRKLKQAGARLLARIQVTAKAKPGSHPLFLAWADGRVRQPVSFQVVAAELPDRKLAGPENVQQPPVNQPPLPAPAPEKTTVEKPLFSPTSQPAIQPDAPPANLQLWSITPNRWQQGKEYTVTIRGKNFQPDQWVRMKDKIGVSTSYQDSDTLKLQLKVSSSAAPGRRTVDLCTGKKPSDTAGPGPKPHCVATTLGGWVIEKLSFAPMMPELACEDLDATDLNLNPDTLLWGRDDINLIYLDSPESGFGWQQGHIKTKPNSSSTGLEPYIEGAYYQYQGIPRLDDQTEFAWSYQHGSVEYYELRFMNRNKKVLKTIRLTASALASSPELVTELYRLVRSEPAFSLPSAEPTPPENGKIPKERGQTAGCYSACYDYRILDEEGQPPPCVLNKPQNEYMTVDEKIDCMRLKHGDGYELLWQVRGFRYGLPCGAAPGKLRAELVAVSDYGYLWLGDSPTGTAQCDQDNTQLTATNQEYKNGKDPDDHSWYPGETIALTGDFSLHRCPWHVDEGLKLQGDNSSHLFSNAFVDWGDGHFTNLEAEMNQKPQPAGDGEASGPDLQGEGVTYSLVRATHKYDQPGRYQARIYVLAEDDLDSLDGIVNHNAYQPPANSGGSGQKGSKKNKTSFSSAPKGGGLQEISGARVYQLYCNPTNITIVQDIAATGPLHLKEIEIVSFSADDSSALQNEKTLSPTVNGQTPIDEGGKATLQPGRTAALSLSINGGGASLQPAGTMVSSCDAGLWARARLDYDGQGYIRLDWKVDGVLLKSEERKLGPSKLRKNLDPDPINWNSDPIIDHSFFISPPLPLRATGNHRVVVNATVIEDPTGSSVNSAALSFTSAGVKGTQYLTLKQATSGRAQISADSYVQSPERQYFSQDKKEGACNLLFAVDDPGDWFLVTGLRDLKVSDHRYSGRGTLVYRLPDSAWSVKEFYQPLEFSGWQAESKAVTPGNTTPMTHLSPGKPLSVSSTANNRQGMLITSGHLETGAGESVDDLPGMRVQLKQLVGDAGDHVNGVLDVAIKDSSLRLSGSETPQQWQGLSAPLTPEGDWYIEDQELLLTQIGWSLFNIKSDDVRIDLSHRRGSATDSSKHPGGPEWIGIHLGQATLYPYTFDLDNTVAIKVRNWVIEQGGLYGSYQGKNGFTHAFGDGAIGWKGLSVDVNASRLDAQYTGMFVEMPWPTVRLEGGDTHLGYAPGENADIQMNFQPGPPVTEEYNAVSMTSTVLGLEHRDAWGINANTDFAFFQNEEPVGTVPVNKMFFTISGKAEFPGDSRSLDIWQKKDFGGATVTWKNIDIHTGGKYSLGFDLNGSLELKEITSADVLIGYGVSGNKESRTASGPEVKKSEEFTFDYAGTGSDAVLRGTITNLQYSGGSSGTGDQAASASRPALYAANTIVSPGTVFSDAWYNPGEYPLLADIGVGTGGSGGASTDTFHATMETELFGGADFTMSFRYGEINDQAYWLSYFDQSLPTPIPLYPSIFMTKFVGGMAYHFAPADLAKNPGQAAPDMTTDLAFAGGVGISILDKVISTEGILTISKPSGPYEILLNKIKVLDINTGLEGKLSFDSSAFDGKLWGEFDFAGGLLNVSAGNQDSNSLGFHMGTDAWYLHVGTKNNKIKVSLLNNTLKGDGYYQLGTDIEGFKAGIGTNANFSTCKGECNKDNANCAYVNGNMDVDIGGSYNPIKFSADGDIGINLGGCGDFWVKKACASIGQDVDFWMGINPNKLGFKASIDFSVEEVELGLKVLPNPELIFNL